MPTDKLFTGQQREPEAVSTLGLYNYGARFYSTLTGRFLSADPVVQDVNDPQAFNAYSYVRNNPLLYVDPAGLCFEVDGTELPCDERKAHNTLDCALNGDNCGKLGDVQLTQELAQEGIQQDLFWENVKEYGKHNWLRDNIIALIFKDKITDARLDLIPAEGWDALGDMFSYKWPGVSGNDYGGVDPLGHITGRFLKASIYDIANGTARIAFLEPKYIIGAYDWWTHLSPHAIGALSREGKYLKQHEEILWDVTLSTARGIQMLAAYNHVCAPLDYYPWSAFQRDHLARFGLAQTYTGCAGLRVDGVCINL